MRIVILIILLLVIVMLGLSMIPEDESTKLQGPPQLTVIEKNKEFYDKLGVTSNENKEVKETKIKVEKKTKSNELKKIDKKSDIISLPKEEDISPKTNTISENTLGLKIIDWSLKGQQKNILVTTFEISNGFESSIKNQKQLLKCDTYDKNETKLSTAETVVEINVRGRDQLTLTDVNLGFVDIDTDNIDCSVQKAPEKKIIDTTLKPLKKLKKINPSNNQESNLKDLSGGGFVFENGNDKASNNDDEFFLPEM